MSKVSHGRCQKIECTCICDSSCFVSATLDSQLYILNCCFKKENLTVLIIINSLAAGAQDVYCTFYT